MPTHAPLRLIFLGSGDFGLPSLEHLHQRHDILAVVTQPDRPAGRKRHMTATPIGSWAAERGIDAIKPPDANDPAVVEQVRAMNADTAIVIAFGQKLSPPLIAVLGKLVVNLHASLLPKYRGAAPINWAMIRGESQTGVSVISLADRMDAGLIYATRAIDIIPTETAGELHDRLANLGPATLDEVLARHVAGTLQGEPQDESRATLAPKLSAVDRRIDFNAPAAAICRRIHGLTPWPGAKVLVCHAQGQLDLKLIRAEPADFVHNAQPGTVLDGHLIAAGAASGAVRLLEVQPPGKRPMTFRQFLNGHAIVVGDRFVPIDQAGLSPR
jgi:methionyl-tRNA formyltransferase